MYEANRHLVRYTERMHLRFARDTDMATSIRLRSAIEQRLDDPDAQIGRSKRYCLRELVAKGLDDMDDFYRAAATVARIRKHEEALG